MVYDPAENRVQLGAPVGGESIYRVGALNRVSQVQEPDSGLVTLQYDAASRRTTLLDANGVTPAYQYLPTDRLTTQLDTNTASGAAVETILAGYYSVGKKVSQTVGMGRATVAYYAGYRLIQQNASNGRAGFVYYPAGSILLSAQRGSHALKIAFDMAFPSVLHHPHAVSRESLA